MEQTISEMGICEYHKDSALDEGGECDECLKEIAQFAQWRDGKTATPPISLLARMAPELLERLQIENAALQLSEVVQAKDPKKFDGGKKSKKRQ